MAKKRKRKNRNRNGNSNPTLQLAPRNPLAFNPLMRRGGAHQKSKSALRSAARRETDQMARDSAYS